MVSKEDNNVEQSSRVNDSKYDSEHRSEPEGSLASSKSDYPQQSQGQGLSDSVARLAEQDNEDFLAQFSLTCSESTTEWNYRYPPPQIVSDYPEAFQASIIKMTEDDARVDRECMELIHRAEASDAKRTSYLSAAIMLGFIIISIFLLYKDQKTAGTVTAFATLLLPYLNQIGARNRFFSTSTKKTMAKGAKPTENKPAKNKSK